MNSKSALTIQATHPMHTVHVDDLRDTIQLEYACDLNTEEHFSCFEDQVYFVTLDVTHDMQYVLDGIAEYGMPPAGSLTPMLNDLCHRGRIPAGWYYFTNARPEVDKE